MQKEKFVVYKTQKEAFRLSFILAYCCIPLLGFGFYILHRLNKHIEKSAVFFFNDRIEAYENDTLIRLKMQNLQKVHKISTEKQKKQELADIVIKSENQKIQCRSIKESDADHIENVLTAAIEAEKNRRALKERAKIPVDQNIKIGALEHMNSLVGMWQQGLISDEDFLKEKAKFSKN
jgi:hypothetical protein